MKFSGGVGSGEVGLCVLFCKAPLLLLVSLARMAAQLHGVVVVAVFPAKGLRPREQAVLRGAFACSPCAHTRTLLMRARVARVMFLLDVVVFCPLPF